MRIALLTYGCQMNVRDSEAVEALLRAAGYTVSPPDEADILIVNTCSVRAKAEAKALGKLGLLIAANRDAPSRRYVGAMGCMVQRMGQNLFKKVPKLDFAVGTHALSQLPTVLEAVLSGEGPVLEIGDADGDVVLEGHAPGQISAFVTILLGCSRACTYCIVPAVRGREWSRPPDKIVAEVRALTAQGAREVTLLGQSVMAYGKRQDVWPPGASPTGYIEPLPRLLEALDAIPELRRIRFTSGHPCGCSAELGRAMADLPSVCEHIHLPCQSGSDAMLRRMRRGYTTDGYRRAVAHLREAMPDLRITTDIIVGFPGETEADFEATRAFMEEIAFDNAFIFKYSPRAGTVAADWPDTVSDDEKARRNQVLLTELDARRDQVHAGWIGRTFEVMAEGPSARNAARWTGRTRGNTIVVFEPAEGMQPGDCVRLRMEAATARVLRGVLES